MNLLKEKGVVKMRVCYIVERHNRLAGGEQSLLNLISHLMKSGVDPYLVCEQDSPVYKYAKEHNIFVFPFSGKIYVMPKTSLKLIGRAKYIIKRVYNAPLVSKAVSYLKENKIDLVHLNTTISCDVWAIAAKKCGIPYVWHLREFLDLDAGWEFVFKSRSYGLFRDADCRVAVSRAVKEHWEEKLNCPCTLVYNGLEPNNNYDSLDGKFQNEKLNCILIGRVTQGKGQMTAAKAIDKLVQSGFTSIHLEIVGFRGNTPYEDELSSYVVSHQLDEYISLVDFSYDLKNLRHNQDVGLVCSTSEAFGRVTIENMMAGLLLVGTNSGGTPELVQNGTTGILYEQGNADELADVLQYVAMHKASAKEIAATGQKHALETFTIEKTAENVLNVYNEVLGKIKN